jgi:hypothetical protein
VSGRSKCEGNKFLEDAHARKLPEHNKKHFKLVKFSTQKWKSLWKLQENPD